MNTDSSRDFSHPLTVVFFGISGAGKGTQAILLEEFLKKNDLSRAVLRVVMGDLVREYMETNTMLARRTKEIVSAGGLLPSFIPNYLLIKYLNENFSGNEHLIFDGTCRTALQSAATDEAMNFVDRTNLRGVVINLSRDAALGRLEARGRSDDVSHETILNRFTFYNESVVPAIAALRERGWEMHDIDGDQTVEVVQRDIFAALNLTQ